MANPYLKFLEIDKETYDAWIEAGLIESNAMYFVFDEGVLHVYKGIKKAYENVITQEYYNAEQAIKKLHITGIEENDLIALMQGLNEGMYRIHTEEHGHELVMISTMWVEDPASEHKIHRKEFSRQIANGVILNWDPSEEVWHTSSGGGVLLFNTEEDFPLVGKPNILYIAKFYDKNEGIGTPDLEELNMLYRYDFAQSMFVPIAGGGGAPGSGVGTQFIFLPEPVNTSLTFAHAVSNPLTINVKYEHPDGMPGTLTILRGTTEVGTLLLSQGINEIDLAPHVRAGNNSITLRASDGFTVRNLRMTITGIVVNLTSTFNDAISYGDEVTIPFRVEGSGTRKLYFTIDGVQEEIDITQVNNFKTLTGLTHGVKEVEMQGAVVIGEQEALSNKLYFNLIIVTQSSPVLISSKFKGDSFSQGTQVVIDYIVWNPTNEFNTVTLNVNGEPFGTVNVDRTRQYWSIRNLPLGENTLSISLGAASISFPVTITPLDVDIYNVEDQYLKAYFHGFGRSNSDLFRGSWANSFGENIAVPLVGFNFASNGWIDDGLLLNGNAHVTIPFKPFEFAIPLLGKTIEIEFETTIGLEQPFIECWHNERGFKIYKDRAVLKSNNTQADVFFKENEKIKLSFVINRTDNTTFVYINGVKTGVDRMSPQTSFVQLTPQPIKINPYYIDGKLYNIRVYDRALDHIEILRNYLYDVIDIDTKLSLYNHSDIFDANGLPDYEKVKERMPVMVVRTYEADPVTGDRMPGTTTADGSFRPFVRVSYEDLQHPDRNFIIPHVRMRTQGTSSAIYPVKNYRFWLGDLDITPFKPWEPNQPDMVRINIKADYMESSLSTDPVLARLFDQMYNTPTPPRAIDGVSRTTIWTGGTLCLWHDDGVNPYQFWGVYNFNGDKGDLRHWGHYPGNGFARSKRFEINFNAANHAVAFVKDPTLTEQQWLNQLYAGFEPQPVEEYTPSVFAELKDFVEFISDADLDTPEGRLAFKEEFEIRAELEYFLKYLLAIFIFGLVDNFGKDVLLSIWDDGTVEKPKWWIVLYDMDSGVGIDNQGRMRDSEGNLLFDYNIELEDQGAFAQASSKLWEAIIKCYPQEIKDTYAELRGGVFSWNHIWGTFIDYINSISKGMYNAHAIQRYIEAHGSDQWLHMLNGDRVNQMHRWISNRLAYLDSKYDYQIGVRVIIARFEIPAPLAGSTQIKARTSIHMYVSAQLGNTVDGTMKARVLMGEVATLINNYGSIGLPFVEFELFNAQYITELVDWKDLPVVTLQLGDAENLQKVDLSKPEPNSLLQSVSFGNNKEMLEINLSNNIGLSGILDLSGAIKLQKLDLRNTAITSVILPNGGVLTELYLPNTIKVLQITNQLYLETVHITEGTELDYLRIENSSVDFRDLLPYLDVEGAVRVTGVYMSSFNDAVLQLLYNTLQGRRGIDATGEIQPNPVIQGEIWTLSAEPLEELIVEWFDDNLKDLVIQQNIFHPNLQYTLINDDTEIAITGFTGAGNGTLFLPSRMHPELSAGNPILNSIEGWVPVTRINNSAFITKAFTHIHVPDTILEIGNSAFTNSTALSSIRLHNNIHTIGQYAFSGTSITEIELPEMLDTLSLGLFMYNPALTTINIPDSIGTIHDQVFDGCTSLTSIFLNTTLINVGAHAFRNINVAALLLAAYEEKPATWNDLWNSSDRTVLWSIRTEPTIFVFDTKGGESIPNYVGRFLPALPTPVRYGYTYTGWESNGAPVNLPLIPDKEGPLTITIEVTSWDIWVYNVEYRLPDNSVHHTQAVTFGEPLGETLDELMPGGLNPPIGEDGAIFREWRRSGNIKVLNDYVITQDANLAGLTVVFTAFFLNAAGMTFTYDVVEGVYNVTNYVSSAPNNSVDLYVPSMWDDGVNGEARVKKVQLGTGTSNASRAKIRTLEFEEGIEIIGQNCMYGGSSLNTVIIPSSITTIEAGAFRAIYRELELIFTDSVENPSALTVIGEYAFWKGSPTSSGSVILTNFPKSVINIERYAFLNAHVTSVSVTHEHNLEVIEADNESFIDCMSDPSLENTVPRRLRVIGSYNSLNSLKYTQRMPCVVPHEIYVPEELNAFLVLIADFEQGFVVTGDPSEFVQDEFGIHANNITIVYNTEATSFIRKPSHIMGVGSLARCKNLEVFVYDNFGGTETTISASVASDVRDGSFLTGAQYIKEAYFNTYTGTWRDRNYAFAGMIRLEQVLFNPAITHTFQSLMSGSTPLTHSVFSGIGVLTTEGTHLVKDHNTNAVIYRSICRTIFTHSKINASFIHRNVANALSLGGNFNGISSYNMTGATIISNEITPEITSVTVPEMFVRATYIGAYRITRNGLRFNAIEGSTNRGHIEELHLNTTTDLDFRDGTNPRLPARGTTIDKFYLKKTGSTGVFNLNVDGLPSMRDETIFEFYDHEDNRPPLAMFNFDHVNNNTSPLPPYRRPWVQKLTDVNGDLHLLSIDITNTNTSISSFQRTDIINRVRKILFHGTGNLNIWRSGMHNWRGLEGVNNEKIQVKRIVDGVEVDMDLSEIIPHINSSLYNCLLDLPENLVAPSVTHNNYRGLKGLTNVSFHPDATSGAGFSYSDVKKLTIHENITNITNSHFQNCEELTLIVCEGTTPPTIGSNTFANGPVNRIIMVPNGSLITYMTATNWSQYISQMIEAPLV
jgi:hypothetical protein